MSPAASFEDMIWQIEHEVELPQEDLSEYEVRDKYHAIREVLIRWFEEE